MKLIKSPTTIKKLQPQPNPNSTADTTSSDPTQSPITVPIPSPTNVPLCGHFEFPNDWKWILWFFQILGNSTTLKVKRRAPSGPISTLDSPSDAPGSELSSALWFSAVRPFAESTTENLWPQKWKIENFFPRSCFFSCAAIPVINSKKRRENNLFHHAMQHQKLSSPPRSACRLISGGVWPYNLTVLEINHFTQISVKVCYTLSGLSYDANSKCTGKYRPWRIEWWARARNPTPSSWSGCWKHFAPIFRKSVFFAPGTDHTCRVAQFVLKLITPEGFQSAALRFQTHFWRSLGRTISLCWNWLHRSFLKSFKFFVFEAYSSIRQAPEPCQPFNSFELAAGPNLPRNWECLLQSR